MSRDPMDPGDHGDYTVKYHPPKKHLRDTPAPVLSIHTGERLNGGGQQEQQSKSSDTPLTGLGEWDAGDDTGLPPPRAWLLGNIFCRGFMSSLLGDGGVGKTATRYAQLLSLAIGRSLTGDHVFQRCRVLVISLEDNRNELERRMLAARLHHGIHASEVKGWLFLAAPGAASGKLMTLDKNGRLLRGELAAHLEAVILARKIDIVSLDPFVKAHSVPENDNSLIDDVVQVLTDLSAKYDIAVDAPHHTSKGPADPGNANRGRGANSMNNAGRLVYTLSTMSEEEAKAFGIEEDRRREYIRMDSAKVNITRHMSAAKWFRLIGVRLGNAAEVYPNGDEVQTVEPWKPPETWADLSSDLLNKILTAIDAGLPDGNRYSAKHAAKDRLAWKVIKDHAPLKTDKQAQEIIGTWIKNGVLEEDEYDNPVTRKKVKGLKVIAANRPS
jgi:AAA domain